MALAILFFSEIIPKNMGVLYRPALQPILIYPLTWVCAIMAPLSGIVAVLVRMILKPAETPPIVTKKSSTRGEKREGRHSNLE